MAKKVVSKGIGGWLGRQLGHIRHAVNAPVTEKTVYKRQSVQQVPVAPNVTARRTVTDELIVEHKKLQ
jgi:hypothetical protein